MIPPVGGLDVIDQSAKETGLLDQNRNVSAGDMSGTTQQTMGQQQVYQSSRQDFMSNSVHHQNSFYTSGGQYRGRANYSDSLYQKQANHSLFNTWDTNKLYLDEVFLYLLCLSLTRNNHLHFLLKHSGHLAGTMLSTIYFISARMYSIQ